jgi:hypothetical protein
MDLPHSDGCLVQAYPAESSVSAGEKIPQ